MRTWIVAIVALVLGAGMLTAGALMPVQVQADNPSGTAPKRADTSGTDTDLVEAAQLAGRQHRFDDMERLARKLIAQAPFGDSGYALLADALIEQGRYRAAATTLQEMLDLRPGFAADARVSYLKESTGDIRGAIRWMEDALSSAGRPEDVSFAAYHLALLVLRDGDTEQAQRLAERALAGDPDGALAHATAGRAAFATGDLDEAIDRFERAFALDPAPEHALALAETHAAAGDDEASDSFYDEVWAIESRLLETGTLAEPELAVIAADAGRVDDAVAIASRLHDKSPSGATQEALGWALHNAGESQQALELLRSSIRSGGDSHTFYFAGEAASALGHTALAEKMFEKALELDRFFSLRYAGDAEASLSGKSALCDRQDKVSPI